MFTHRARLAAVLRTALSQVLAASLAGCSPPGSSPAGSSGEPPTPPQDAGAKIYNGSCVACHQQNGRGIPGVYPSLAGSPVVVGDPKALALWVIKGQRADAMPPGRYSTAMPLFGWLNPEDAAALFSYLRTHFGNSSAPVDAATVAAALGEGKGTAP